MDGTLTEFSEEVNFNLNSAAKAGCRGEELRRGEEFKSKIQHGQETFPSQSAARGPVQQKAE